MKITAVQAVELLVANPDHKPVLMIFADGERIRIEPADALNIALNLPAYKFQSRFGLLHKISETVASMPAAESVAQVVTVAKWQRCHATTTRACLPISPEWIAGLRPDAAIEVSAIS